MILFGLIKSYEIMVVWAMKIELDVNTGIFMGSYEGDTGIFKA